MTITTTAIAFSLSSLGLAFCGIRFFRAFQKMGGSRAGRKIGLLLSGLLLGTALQHGVLALNSLFFIKNTEVFYKIIALDHIILTAATGIGIYVVFYIFFPSVSPWPAIVVVSILGMTIAGLTLTTQPRSFIDASGGIDWNFSRQLSILLFCLLFLNIGAQLLIFIQSFLQAKSREVKIISFVIVVLTSIGIVNVFRRFLILDTASDFLQTRIFDTILAVIGLVFITVFLLPPIAIRWISRSRDHQT